MRRFLNFARRLPAVLCLPLLLAACGPTPDDPAAADGASTTAAVKLGFLVKQPEEPWFQLEWTFAQQAADELGFELVKLGVPDGERTLNALDSLAVQGVDGLVICTPDVRLGPAIKAKADAAGMKLISVDDRFVGPDGPMETVPHMGISARKIGETAGAAVAAEMDARGWRADDAPPVGLMVVTFDELDTGRARTEGAVAALRDAGFPEDRVYRAPQKTSDVPGAFAAADVVLNQQTEVRHWAVVGINDNGVLGGIRAIEGRGFTPDEIIGVGINGTEAAAEFRKDTTTGLHASILLSARSHGYETAKMLHRWVTEGVAPPPVTFTEGRLITRENFAEVLAEEGVE